MHVTGKSGSPPNLSSRGSISPRFPKNLTIFLLPADDRQFYVCCAPNGKNPQIASVFHYLAVRPDDIVKYALFTTKGQGVCGIIGGDNVEKMSCIFFDKR